MKKGKITLLAAALLCITSLAAAPKATESTVNASDSKITYIGRTEVKDGCVSFDWTGVYAKVKFQGNSLSFKVSDTKKNYFNVWIDNSMSSTPDKVITVHGTDTTIVLFSAEELKARFGKDKKAAKAPHQVILQKRTEGEQGTTTIKEFITDGQFLQADAPKARIIEYIGDSYTCGYGTESSNKERFKPETENQNLTYACAMARYFDADQIVLAHSGMGIARNYNGNVSYACTINMVDSNKEYFEINNWQLKELVFPGNWSGNWGICIVTDRLGQKLEIKGCEREGHYHDNYMSMIELCITNFIKFANSNYCALSTVFAIDQDFLINPYKPDIWSFSNSKIMAESISQYMGLFQQLKNMINSDPDFDYDQKKSYIEKYSEIAIKTVWEKLSKYHK